LKGKTNWAAEESPGVRSPFADSPEFRRLLGGDARADLVRIALEIARDAYPDVDPGRYMATIDGLAARVRDRCPAAAKSRHVLGQINWVLFVEEGFRGNADDYYDPRNSYLNEVIDRRTGIPISLSVLYWAVADRLGLEMAGVNLPRHFMLRVGEGAGTIFVDPFHAGALLDRGGCARRISELSGEPVAATDALFAPCATDRVVARMLRNLKAIYLQDRDFAAALPVLRRLAALAPGDPEEQRDYAMLCLRLDRPADAVAPLQAYLDARPHADDVATLGSLLRAARREVAARN
jgi:regulator of sirC expression with transglutaminase-like and TPR domain